MSKVKTPDPKTQEPADWADAIQQHPAFEWLMENRRYIPYFFVFVLALIALGYKFASGSSASAEANYQLADGYWERIQQNISDETGLKKQENALVQLEKIINQYPELHSKYDGLMAQLLLAYGRSDDAIPYAKRTQDRTSTLQDPAYQTFSESTLLIAEGRHQEALKKTLDLKEKLLKMPENHLLLPYLYIRIAMLYQGMGEKDLEILAWDEWLQYANGEGVKKPDPNALATISTLFSEGAFTLSKYIEMRKNG